MAVTRVIFKNSCTCFTTCQRSWFKYVVWLELQMLNFGSEETLEKSTETSQCKTHVVQWLTHCSATHFISWFWQLKYVMLYTKCSN